MMKSNYSQSRPDQIGKQLGETIPCDLDTDAKQNERYYSQDSMRSRWRNYLGDLRRIRIAEVDKHAENDHGEKYSNMGQNIF